MKKTSTLLLLLLLIPISMVLGQEATTIKGKVTDENGAALPSANVLIRSLNIGAATDVNGNYSFEVPAEQSQGQTVSLTARYVGYKETTVQIVLSGKTIEQNFSLATDVFQSEQVVVTGIASQTSKSVAEVSVSRLDAVGYTNSNSYQSVSQLLSGKIAGVQLTHSSGNVGSGFQFYVRGGGGINGNEQPIIYLDGVRIDNSQLGFFGVGGQGISALSSLNPNDIAKIEVLKGPAAAALYGTDGSNGVVLITTKSGGLVPGGKGISVNYNFTYGYNEQADKYTTDYYLTANDANANFVKGYIRQHEFSVSGGSSFLRYYGGFTSRSEGGIMPTNNLLRKSARLDLTAYPNDELTVRVNGSYSHNIVNQPQNDNNIYGFLGNTLLYHIPYIFQDSAGIYALTTKDDIENFTGNVAFTYTPSWFKNFEIDANAGLNSRSYREDQLEPPQFSWSNVNNGEHDVYHSQNKLYTYTANARYKYNITSDITGNTVLGTQLTNNQNSNFQVQIQNFASQLITAIGAGVDATGWGEFFLNDRTAGIYIDNSFAYQDKVFFTLGVRRDYASTVGADAPNIYYPKASVAFRLDKFNLVPTSFFQLFKLRAAYGESGQLPNTTDAIPYLWSAVAGGYGGGGILNSIGNPNIKPERIKELEVGVDAEFMNMFSLEFTYWIQRASNSIVGFSNPPSTGLTASRVPFNVGSVKAHGFESQLQASLFKSRDYGLDLSMIWNYQTNEVSDLGGAPMIYDGYHVNVIKEGMPKHEFYATVTTPVFDANGVYTGDQASPDPVDLGNPIPTWTGSFSANFKFLKNFNLYTLFDWALDRKEMNWTASFAAAFGNYVPRIDLANQLDLVSTSSFQYKPNIQRLTPGTPEYIAAAKAYSATNGNYDGNWVFDAKFLKLREISISYDFTDLLKDYLTGTYISNLTIGFSARNVWTATPYKGGDDVEVSFNGARSLTRGVDFLTLPNPRTYNFWARVAF